MDQQMQTGISQDGFPAIEDNSNEQLTLFSLQDLAVNNTNSLESLKKKLKTARDMYAELFIHDSAYHEANLGVKEKQIELKRVKVNLKNMPQAVALEEEMKNIRSEIKDKKESIASSALEMYRLSGNTEFEKDGDIFQVKTVAKLVKQRKRKS